MTGTAVAPSKMARLRARSRTRRELQVLVEDGVLQVLAATEERELLATVGVDVVERRLAALEGDPTPKDLRAREVAQEQVELARSEADAAREAVREATVVLRLEALPAGEWRALLSAHEATAEQQAEQPQGSRLLFNPDTFPTALILASLGLDRDAQREAEEWLPVLSFGEFEGLFAACWDLNHVSALDVEGAVT